METKVQDQVIGLADKIFAYLPNLLAGIVLIFVGLLAGCWSGYLLSFLAEKSIFKSLHKEEIPGASLISRFIKIILMLFFSAIALVELDVAREIVIIGFATIFITICVISVVITIIGGKNFIEKIGDSLKEKQS